MFFASLQKQNKKRSFSLYSTGEYSHQEISAEPHSPGSAAEVEASQIIHWEMSAKHWQLWKLSVKKG